jgi:hypothetical protein
MRKLTLAASLCTAAFALASTTAASAENPSGKCMIHGSAAFSPGDLSAIPTSHLGYRFIGWAECEILPAREIHKGTVEVRGEETLSCLGSLGEAEGAGTLTLEGIKFPFGLTFVSGSPGSTGLVAKFADGGVAAGSATFLLSVIEPALACFSNEGASELEFKAVATGTL